MRKSIVYAAAKQDMTRLLFWGVLCAVATCALFVTRDLPLKSRISSLEQRIEKLERDLAK